MYPDCFFSSFGAQWVEKDCPVQGLRFSYIIVAPYSCSFSYSSVVCLGGDTIPNDVYSMFLTNLLSHSQAILHATLDRSSISVGKFSRWLRAICTILLSRNTHGDRTKAIGYVEQAIAVLEEHSEGDQDSEHVRNLGSSILFMLMYILLDVS
jgi:hypothetical protein